MTRFINIAPMRKGPYGISSKTEIKRHKNVTVFFLQIDGVKRQRNFFTPLFILSLGALACLL